MTHQKQADDALTLRLPQYSVKKWRVPEDTQARIDEMVARWLGKLEPNNDNR